MASIRFQGMEAYDQKIDALGKNMENLATGMVYAAAGVAADAIREEIGKIPGNLLNQVQRDGLKEGLGVARIETKEGVTTTRVGFAGYNALRSGKLKEKGQANVLVARIVAKGTSHRAGKYDFVKIAVRNSRKQAVESMQESLNQEIEERMRG